MRNNLTDKSNKRIELNLLVCGKKLHNLDALKRSSTSSFSTKVYQLDDLVPQVPLGTPQKANYGNLKKKTIQINVNDYKNPLVLTKEVKAIREATEVEDFRRILNGTGRRLTFPTKDNYCFSKEEIEEIYNEFFGRYFDQLKQINVDRAEK